MVRANPGPGDQRPPWRRGGDGGGGGVTRTTEASERATPGESQGPHTSRQPWPASAARPSGAATAGPSVALHTHLLSCLVGPEL